MKISHYTREKLSFLRRMKLRTKRCFNAADEDKVHHKHKEKNKGKKNAKNKK